MAPQSETRRGESGRQGGRCAPRDRAAVSRARAVGALQSSENARTCLESGGRVDGKGRAGASAVAFDGEPVFSGRRFSWRPAHRQTVCAMKPKIEKLETRRSPALLARAIFPAPCKQKVRAALAASFLRTKRRSTVTLLISWIRAATVVERPTHRPPWPPTL